MNLDLQLAQRLHNIYSSRFLPFKVSILPSWRLLTRVWWSTGVRIRWFRVALLHFLGKWSLPKITRLSDTRGCCKAKFEEIRRFISHSSTTLSFGFYLQWWECWLRDSRSNIQFSTNLWRSHRYIGEGQFSCNHSLDIVCLFPIRYSNPSS